MIEDKIKILNKLMLYVIFIYKLINILYICYTRSFYLRNDIFKDPLSNTYKYDNTYCNQIIGLN